MGEALASLRPPIPNWMETSFALDHVIPSGFYIHFTCKEGPYPDLKYKEYQEPEDLDEGDDAIDGKFGLFCSDGTFVQRPWPPEKQCVEIALCENVPVPDPSKRYKPLVAQSVFKKGQFIHYECAEPSAILDDHSGRNYFSLFCDGEDSLGVYSPAYNLTQTQSIGNVQPLSI